MSFAVYDNLGAQWTDNGFFICDKVQMEANIPAYADRTEKEFSFYVPCDCVIEVCASADYNIELITTIIQNEEIKYRAYDNKSSSFQYHYFVTSTILECRTNDKITIRFSGGLSVQGMKNYPFAWYPRFNITAKTISSGGSSISTELETTISAITSSLKTLQSEFKGSKEVPTIAVPCNIAFEVELGCYDDILSGVSLDGKVSVENTAVGDDKIVVRGQIETAGFYQEIVSGKKFNIKVFPVPTSTNVTVTLE